MTLTDEQIASAREMGRQFKRTYDDFLASVTDEDRLILKERLGIDPSTHRIGRATMKPWTYALKTGGGGTVIPIGNDEAIVFWPLESPLPDKVDGPSPRNIVGAALAIIRDSEKFLVGI